VDADEGWQRREAKAAEESSKQQRKRSAGGSLRGGDLQRSGSNGAGSSGAVLWRRPAAMRSQGARSSERWKVGKCREEDEVEPHSLYIEEGSSGLATAGPRRFSSWAATWHEDTRAKNKMPQGGRTDPERRPGSGVAQ
jgi:hypothetical protein